MRLLAISLVLLLDYSPSSNASFGLAHHIGGTASSLVPGLIIGSRPDGDAKKWWGCASHHSSATRRGVLKVLSNAREGIKSTNGGRRKMRLSTPCVRIRCRLPLDFEMGAGKWNLLKKGEKVGWVSSRLAMLATTQSGTDVGVDEYINKCVYISTLNNVYILLSQDIQQKSATSNKFRLLDHRPPTRLQGKSRSYPWCCCPTMRGRV